MPDNPNPTPDPDPVDQTDDLVAVRHEAANRRKQLRATEAERDALRERLDTVDRREVERLAAEKMANPADLFLVTSVDALRGEDGMIDLAKAESEVDRILSEREHWRKPQALPAPVPRPAHPDLHQGPMPRQAEGPSFGQAIRSALSGG